MFTRKIKKIKSWLLYDKVMKLFDKLADNSINVKMNERVILREKFEAIIAKANDKQVEIFIERCILQLKKQKVQKELVKAQQSAGRTTGGYKTNIHYSD